MIDAIPRPAGTAGLCGTHADFMHHRSPVLRTSDPVGANGVQAIHRKPPKEATRGGRSLVADQYLWAPPRSTLPKGENPRSTACAHTNANLPPPADGRKSCGPGARTRAPV